MTTKYTIERGRKHFAKGLLAHLTPLLLPLIALVVGLSAQLLPRESVADDCVIEQDTDWVGSFWRPRSLTIESMSEITAIELLETATPSWAYSCPAGSYTFEDNILSTARYCRGRFHVTGLQAGCTPTGGGGEISQSPLFLGGDIEPNVMFLLDDSGSMQFEIMPDDYVFFGVYDGSVVYTYPRASGIYGADDYTNVVATVDDSAGYNALVRSAQVNTVYYNPAVTYTPWIRSDGSYYPDADPSCALHNPERAGTGSSYCRNMTANNSQSAYWSTCYSGGSCSQTGWSSRTFWPATYFYHNGGSIWTRGNYTKVEIRSSVATYSGQGREARTDCADADNGNCTYAEEIQNFANWYTYYRSRILAARAGIGLAFSQQGSGMRVGFGAINEDSSNVDGVDTSVIINGVRPFTGSDRDDFFDILYDHTIPAAGTPLRYALDKAGQYYERSDNRGPWGATPGTDDSTEHLQCRRSYSVLMTDGYWSGGSSYDAATSGARNNNDGTGGPSHAGTDITGNPLSFTYSAVSPFTDSRSNTLADVAMYYWKRDLRGDLTNEVPVTDDNPAFWQHMITFGVGLGVTGSVDPGDAFSAIDSGATITWPDPDTSETNCTGSHCPARIDDLLHSAVNSRGGFFSAADPNTFASELANVLQTIAAETRSSASSVAANTTRLDTNTLVYQARFDSSDWSGQIIAYRINADGTLGSVEWDTTQAGKIPAPGSRDIFTWNGGAGTAFAWANLTSAQQDALKGGGSTTTGQNRLNWLRGDQSLEGTTFRERSVTVLGDIINSDPWFVGKQNFSFHVLPGTEGSSYTAFRLGTAYQERTPMLYVGANDGMLHGFDAETGVEKIAYVPAGVYTHLASLTDPNYTHKFYVDGSPRVLDAYLNSAWHTVLVGSTGAGGRSVFALDVTDPDSFSASDVMWEYTNAELGVAIGQPTIARVKAGDKWVAIFGNGYNSTSGRARLFVVDLSNGSLIRTIDTGVGDADDPNGLSSVVPVDKNGDRITDYIYAGDLYGNLWKFDLTDASSSNWNSAVLSGGAPAPLFTAKDGSDNRQPITARPAVYAYPNVNAGRMVLFGTGQFFAVGDDEDMQVQTLYGIWDDDDTNVPVPGRNVLQDQTILWQGAQSYTTPSGDTVDYNLRVVSDTDVNYPTKKGWYIDLIYQGNAEGERVVSPGILRDERVVFATLIPETDPCGFGGTSWLMELDAVNGRRLAYTVFDLNLDSLFNEVEWVTVTIDGEEVSVPVSGKQSGVGIVKTPGVITAGEVEYKYTSGSSGGLERTVELGGGGAGRQSWRQLQ